MTMIVGLNRPLKELTTEQIASFRRNGHICLRGALTADEVATWRAVIRDAAYRHNAQTKPLAERDEYGKSFLQVINLWEKDDRVRPFTLARRFAKLAADVMGTATVRLYHDQALFKEPGGTPTHWHQDQTYMPFDTPHLIGLWIPLVPVPPEVGSMRFVSGSHTLGWLGKLPYSTAADPLVQRIVRDHGLSYAWYGAMEPGDVTFHSSWVLHSAAGNPTPNVREIMNIFYLDGAARIVAPMSADHEIGLKYNVGDRPVGALPDSPHNPIVYP